MTAQPQRPAFGTLLTSHMAVATFQGRPLEPERDQTGRADRAESGRACAALRQHLLRGLQGLPPRRRLGARVSHGSAHPAHAAERAATGAAGTGCGAARRHGARGDRALPRCGAGSAGRAVSAAHPVRHDREHRCGGDAHGGGLADRAGEPGVGLFRRRHEAAAHSGRRREHALGGADGHGQDRRQLRRRLGSHACARGRSIRWIRCCSARAARCRRPAPRISC